jgi:uncharacterized protein YdeI (YjbR/CyaY-like superfamily)
MKNDINELIFESRATFHSWLEENASTSEGVWLVFGKTKELKTVSANDALEEALCFGWIDGLMKSIDETRYIKYFSPRRKKSVWSDKNKALISSLREKGLMTDLGEAAVSEAIKNGSWDAPKNEPFTEEQTNELIELIKGSEPAYTNFMKMSPSVKRTYTAAYFSGKSEETRKKALQRIIDRCNQNLKPM